MASITLSKLIAWHLLMVASLALCWVVTDLWILPVAVANLAMLMVRPPPEQRASSLFSSFAIVFTISMLGTFLIALDANWLERGIFTAVPPAYVRWLALALLAQASLRLITCWRNSNSPSADPTPPEKSGRTYAYHCPSCQQPDGVEAISVIPEPKFTSWNCPACGQLVGPALKHPVVLVFLHTIFLALYLVVTAMKLCPLWVSVMGLIISHGIIHYLAGGIKIVPIARQKDFIEEEMTSRP
ncbi:MAG: hypothetical protein KF712_18380 [Akkermansiaceae bacterium]|nr:hypothetical protein [Akkermansiaceae bacterium]